MAKIRPAYGFQENVFKMLHEKGENLKETEKHGVLLIDEMKLSHGLSFNKSTRLVNGLVDLGNYTPQKHEKELGDHGLVFMYQPLRGKWIQTIAAFCSKGAATGDILEKLVVEAVGLLEKSGFKVDGVVTDGGPWNRVMWKLFGVSEKKCSCIHPVDNERALYFFSDFPHLMKTVWSRIRKSGIVQSPDGPIKFSYWERLVLDDEKRHVKRNYFLTRSNIYPKHYQTMNVKLAFQFFSGKTARVMKFCLNSGDPNFVGCEPTMKFINRMNDLSDAMNSRIPREALQHNKNSKHYKSIQEFIEFMEKWKIQYPNSKFRLTPQTHLGLMVTLKSTLELLEYLHNDLNYDYIMTRRLNQDALEHFFGNIRSACGSNDHPDPLQFIQLYRLLSVYSLVKPPRGSNVSGEEVLKTLFSLKDIVHEESQKRKVELEKKFDEMLDSGDFYLLEGFFDYEVRPDIDPPALRNFTGYVVRRAKNGSVAKECSECFESLKSKDNSDSDAGLIECLSHGYLLNPSNLLMDVIYRCETAILNTLEKNGIGIDVIMQVADEVVNMGIPNLVGCANEEHKHCLTKWIINFYLNTRMIFACKEKTKEVEDTKTKSRQLKKNAKLHNA